MSKFKVGDKVRVRSDLNGNDKYYNEDKSTCDCCVDEIIDLRGKVVTIKEVGTTGKYRICEGSYSWVDEMFSGLAEPAREFIVLRRDGMQVIASHKRGDEIVKTAKATCNASDTFDFGTGAKLAFDRLMGREEPKPAPQPAYRFKVGDRVKTYCDVGTIVKIDSIGDPLVLHDTWNHGHNGTGGMQANELKLTGNKASWFDKSNVTQIEE